MFILGNPYIKGFLISLVFILPASLYAQDLVQTGVRLGVLPEVSFNLDDGIRIGGEFQIYDYKDGKPQPFKSLSRIRAIYKTDRAFAFGFFRDEVDFLDTDIRIFYNAFTTQNFADYFFGDTDAVEYNKALFDSTSFYSFKSFKISAGGSIRFPVTRGAGLDRFDIKTGISFAYESPWGNPEDRFINTTDIQGSNGAQLTLFELGLVLERRSSEFRAQEGFLLDVTTKYASPINKYPPRSGECGTSIRFFTPYKT